MRPRSAPDACAEPTAALRPGGGHGRSCRFSVLPGTDHRSFGVGETVINQQQMVHIRQSHDTLNEGTNHLGLVEADRQHPNLLAGH